MCCLMPEAVADLDTTFSPVSRTTNSSCERVEHELTPQRLKWRLQCSGQIDMDVQGEFNFDSPEHYVAHHYGTLIHAGTPHAVGAHVDRGTARRRLPAMNRRPGLLPLSLELIS